MLIKNYVRILKDNYPEICAEGFWCYLRLIHYFGNTNKTIQNRVKTGVLCQFPTDFSALKNFPVFP